MGHEFDNGFALDWDMLWRSLLSSLIFMGGIVGAWLLPAFLRLIFRHVVRAEVIYQPPEHYDVGLDQYRRRRYAHASYWRTSFFDLLYVIVGISAFITGIMLALWLLHWDFWFLVAGLGLYTAIALFQVGLYLQNIFAFFCLKMDYHCHVREGDFIEVAGYRGTLVYIGIQRSKLMVTTTPPSINSPLNTITTTTTNVGNGIATLTSTSGKHNEPKIIFIPTAHLMQIVVRIDRAL